MIRKTLAGMLLMLVVAGCGSTYYKISPPGGTTTYYATGYQDLGYGQGVRFTDLKTGSQVTLPASDIQKIDKKDLPADLQSK